MLEIDAYHINKTTFITKIIKYYADFRLGYKEGSYAVQGWNANRVEFYRKLN